MYWYISYCNLFHDVCLIIRVLLTPDTGEIRCYIKAMRELDTNKIKDKREADNLLSEHIPVRPYLVK